MESNISANDKTNEKIIKFFRKRIFSLMNSSQVISNNNHKLIIERELSKIMDYKFIKNAKLPISEVKSKIKEEIKICEEILKNVNEKRQNSLKLVRKVDENHQIKKTNNIKKSFDNQNLNNNLKKTKDFLPKRNFNLDLGKGPSLIKGKLHNGNEEKLGKDIKKVDENTIDKKLLPTNNKDVGKIKSHKEKIERNKLFFNDTNNLVNNITKVDPNQKYYLVSGGYPDVVEALKNLGYKESHNPDLFDFNWSLKTSSINYKKLKTHQTVNHFMNNKEFTSKFGLCKNIRSIILNHNVDIDAFYPRCYDLEDKLDFADFVEDFKFQKAEALLKDFAFGNIRISEEKLTVSIDICERKLKYYDYLKDNKEICDLNKFIVTINEWALISEEMTMGNINKLNSTINEVNQYIYTKQTEQDYKSSIVNILKELEKNDPQFYINGSHNIWILKPSGLSRGRGIKCLSSLQELMKSMSDVFNNYVIQKYIENPLIIMRKKFDIRQWVTVTSFNPLNVLIYDEPYVRFSAENYNPDNVSNLFSHLTNNSIAKNSKKFENSEIEGNMWDVSQFKDYINSYFGDDSYSKIKKQFWDYVILSLESCKDKIENRKNSFEVYGYDFMIDENLKVWLIEINSSPAMDYSTHVTEKIVKNGVKELLEFILKKEIKSERDNDTINTGKWKYAMKNGLRIMN